MGYFIRWCTVVGSVIIFIYSRKYWETVGLFYRVILFAVLIMALTEQLLRSSIMAMVVGYPLALQGLSAMPVYAEYLVLSLLISFFVPMLSRTARGQFLKYFVFSIFAAAVVSGAKEIIENLILPLKEFVPPWDASKIIHLPYGMKVLIPAYITFLEPTVASFVVFYLIEDRLKKFSTLSKGLIMGGLISLIHGGIYSIVQIVNSEGSFIYRLFYYGQFLWEYFALGILTAYSFLRCFRGTR